jgi:hypothetical protein
VLVCWLEALGSGDCGEDSCRVESELNVECEMVVVGEERVVELESELQGVAEGA